MRAVETAASSRGVSAIAIQVGAAAEIDPAITSFARESHGGLILLTDTFTTLHQKRIVELADRHRLPAISWNPVFARVGGLMSYSVTVTTLEQYRRAAASRSHSQRSQTRRPANSAGRQIHSRHQPQDCQSAWADFAAAAAAARPRRRGDRIERLLCCDCSQPLVARNGRRMSVHGGKAVVQRTSPE
jgi:hypothetical protein